VGYGRQYAANTVTTLVAAIIMGVLFYVLRIVLFQSLSIEAYGLFYAVFAFGVTIQAFVTFGFDPGITPIVTRMNERGDFAEIKQLAVAVLLRQLAIASVVAIFCIVFADPLTRRIFDDSSAVELVVPIMCYMGLIVVFKTGHAILLGLHAVQARNLVDVVRVSVALATAVWFLREGWGIQAAAWAYAASAAAAIAAQVVAMIIQARPVIRAPFAWRPDLARDVFRSGKYLSIAFVSLMLFSQMDTLMLTLLKEDFARIVGTYQVAVPTIMIGYSLLAAIAVSFMPMVTTLDIRGERRLLADGLDRMYSAAFAVFLPASIAAAGFGDVLIAMLFRRDTYDAAAAFAILSSGCIFYFICYLNLQVLAGLGLVRRAGAIIAGALAVNLVLNIVLIPAFGIRGAGLATVASFALGAASTGMAIAKHFQHRFHIHGMVTSTIAAVVIALAVQWIREWNVFSEHPYWIAPIAGGVLWLGAVAILEFAGFVRLRELAKTILRPRRVESNNESSQ
jgi:O-antigen/teichoic acid export membrane protein